MELTDNIWDWLIVSFIKVKPLPAIFSFITNPELFSIALIGFNSIALPAILLGVVICSNIEFETVSISLSVIRVPDTLGQVIIILLLILFDFKEVILLLLWILIAERGLFTLFVLVVYMCNAFKFNSLKWFIDVKMVFEINGSCVDELSIFVNNEYVRFKSNDLIKPEYLYKLLLLYLDTNPL